VASVAQVGDDLGHPIGSSGASLTPTHIASVRRVDDVSFSFSRRSGASLCIPDPAIWGSSARSDTVRFSSLSPPSAAADYDEFSPARPPGLGGGHRALGLADAVAHEPCGGSPVQGYKG
jgi:hypothetical protein